jgi:peptidoglycan/xylan/chitin deacetylase (PgdA/CDA1 family)
VRRHRIAALRACGERALLAVRDAQQHNAGGRILAYHGVGTPNWGVNSVTPAQFRRHIETALASGYRFMPAAAIARGEGSAKDLAITFDDGLASVAEHAAPILSAYGIPWTFFIVTEYAEGRHPFPPGVTLDWKGIEGVAAHGATIGSHSATHRNFSTLSADEAAHELFTSRRVIEERLGVRVTEFAIPFGRGRDWNATAHQHAHAAGYDLIYAYCHDRRYPGTIARTGILSCDGDRFFRAALRGAFDQWEEWF